MSLASLLVECSDRYMAHAKKSRRPGRSSPTVSAKSRLSRAASTQAELSAFYASHPTELSMQWLAPSTARRGPVLAN
jgi:hypothetical protein